MASAKEYNMLFKLSAQLGKDFNTTFSSAKRTMSDTQKEIASLGRQQSDITAYQKQQQAVDATARKLSDLQREYDNIQREIEETGTFSSALENKLIEKQRAIDKTSNSLDRQNEKLKGMEAALNDAGIDTQNLTAESEKLASEMDRLAEENAKAAEQAENFGAEGENAFGVVGDALIAAGIAAGLKEIYDAYKECVTIASNFEATMSTVEALSGASAEELSSLSTMAKNLGATTKFTATESAEAMTYMAMAGWDAEQMLSGMDGVMQLAAASGEDLAMVSDIVTDNLTAFGLKASDTAHFADILAAAATSSNTSVSIMGETFKNSAALAGALGYSVEDVAVAIGLMANAGIKGSNAGTALKNIFNGLLEGVTLTSEAFGEVEYSAINADGTMKSFGETINDLRGYFSQMTGAEQLHNAETIAGQRAMSGFVSILNSTQADYDALTNSINNCAGSAQKMADIKLDNLNGQVTLMNSAADALRTTIGEAFMPELRALAEVGTDILTGMQKFAEENPVIVKSLILIAGEIGTILIAYKSYQAIKTATNVLHAASAALKAKETAATVAHTAAVGTETTATAGATVAQNALNAAMAANPIGLVITAVAALTVGIVALTNATKKEVDETEKLSAVSQEQYTKIQSLRAEYEAACEKYGEASEEARTLHGELVLLNDEFESSKTTLEEYENSVASAIQSYDNFVAERKESIASIETEGDVTLALVSRLMALANQSGKTAVEQREISLLVDQLNSKLPELGLNYDSVTESLNMTAEAIRSAAQAEIDRQKYLENLEAYNKALEEQAKLEKSLSDARKEASAASDEAWSYLNSDEYQEMFDAFQHTMGPVAFNILKLYYKPVEEKYNDLQKHSQDALKNVGELESRYNSASDTVDNLAKEITEYEQALAESNNESENAADSMDDLQENAKSLRSALSMMSDGYFDVEAAARYYNVNVDALQEASDAFEQHKESLLLAVDAVNSGYYTVSEAARAYGVAAEAIDTTIDIQGVIDEIGQLGEAYNDVKNAAEESINGQYSLWDTAAVVIAVDIDKINTALETQLSYWSDYNTDLTDLLARTDEIDGLSEVIASFADGSADSVNAIAGMAAASDEDLRKMVANWQEVQRQQEEASESIAEIATGFGDEIDGMSERLNEAVDGLNLKGEAALAAHQTVDAYVQAIRDGTDDAVKAAERLSSLVAAALTQADLDGVYDSGGGNSSKDPMLIPSKKVHATYNAAYASGTENAVRGNVLVGEYGPEIISLHGGERVFDATETASIMQAYKDLAQFSATHQIQEASAPRPMNADERGSDHQVIVTISPSFVIEGNAGDDMEARLRAASEDIVETIRDALEEAGIDAKRGAYI